MWTFSETRFGYWARLLAFSVGGIVLFLFISLREMFRLTRAARRGVTADRRIGSRLATAAAFLPDLLVYAAEISRQRPRWRYEPPSAFRDEIVDVGAKVGLSCSVGEQPRHVPCVIIVPGMFNTRRQNMVLALARLVFARWKWHVVVPDMRGFGDTGRMNPAPPTGSWLEGRDITKVAEWSRRYLPTTFVFVIGFSYGGAIALAAAARGGVDGVVAFSPFAQLGVMLDRLSTRPALSDPFWLFGTFFSWLHSNFCAARGLTATLLFRDYFETVVAPYYAVTASELYERSSPLSYIEAIATPTLILHSNDDPIIPASETIALAERCRSDSVQFVLTDGRGHFADLLCAPVATEQTLRAFFQSIVNKSSIA